MSTGTSSAEMGSFSRICCNLATSLEDSKSVYKGTHSAKFIFSYLRRTVKVWTEFNHKKLRWKRQNFKIVVTAEKRHAASSLRPAAMLIP